MTLLTSVKFKDIKSFEKNKTKTNVRAVYDDEKIIVFKDRNPVTPDKTKVSHTYSFGNLKSGVPTSIVRMRCKHINHGVAFCQRNNIKIIKQLDNFAWVTAELPEHMDFGTFHTIAMQSGAFYAIYQNRIKKIIPTANYTYDGQWQLPALRCQEAWDLIAQNPPANDNVVCVIDWGCDTDHPDLAGKTFNNKNLRTGTTDVRPMSSEDKHGTCCTGQIVAKNDNLYSTGISPYNTKVSFAYINDNGTIDGIEHAMTMPNCVAVSMSYMNGAYSSPAGPDPAEQVMITDALLYGRGGNANTNQLGLGIVVCAAAGNGNCNGGCAPPPNRPIYPGGYDGVCAITATTPYGNDYRKTFWADYGTNLFAAAPGDGTPATDRLGAAGYSADDTTLFGGTSGATPIFAGVVALVNAANPNLSANGIKQAIKNTCRKIGGYDYNIIPGSTGKSIETGWGQVDAYSAVLYAISGQIDPGPSLTPNLRVIVTGGNSATIDSDYVITYSLFTNIAVSQATTLTVTLFYSTDIVYDNADQVITTLQVTIPANDFYYQGTYTFRIPSTLVGDYYFGANATSIPQETYLLDNTGFNFVNIVGPPPPLNTNLRVEVDTVTLNDAKTQAIVSYELENTGINTITTFTIKKGFVGYEERVFRLEFTLEPDQILNLRDTWSNVPPVNVVYDTPYKIEIISVNDIAPDDATYDNISTMYAIAPMP